MPYDAIVKILAPDRVGLVAAVTGRLFDLGGDLADTVFSVLGEAAEFTLVVTLDDDQDPASVRAALAELPQLDRATVEVSRFDPPPSQSPSARVTHHIDCLGRDQPGLLARLSEAMVEYGVNVVRLVSRGTVASAGRDYRIQMDVFIPPGRENVCLAALSNTAAALGQEIRWTAAASEKSPA